MSVNGHIITELEGEKDRLNNVVEGYEATWRILLREVGLPENSPDPAVAIMLLVDTLKNTVQQQDESRIKLANSC